MATIAITGATGLMGRELRPRLLARGHTLRLLARRDDLKARPGEHAVRGSLDDEASLEELTAGADAAVHLAGYSQERPWRDILAVNIDATQRLLDVCRRNETQRVLLASSHHVAGMVPVGHLHAAPVMSPRPDSFYGVGKAALEALGSLYADRFEMTIVSARIGTALDAPDSPRTLATWLSHDDFARLVEATVRLHDPGHHIVWAVSANQAAWFDLAAGHAIGFAPHDDAALAAPASVVSEAASHPVPASARLGGSAADREVGLAW